MASRPEFLCGIELECQSFVEDGPAGKPEGQALDRLLNAHYSAAPALRGRTGFFNAYGRVYLDWGHYELATAECSSPYDVPSVLERQELLLAGVLAKLRRENLRLRIANNNHSGLLDVAAPTWGAHESYLVEREPSTFGPSILPFLCTRVYAGAGGVVASDASFVAGVRGMFMQLDEGGMTSDQRAIHSTCRSEPLMARELGRFRYHLLLGDGQRSQFALALRMGATMLALKAVLHGPDLRDRVHAVGYRAADGAAGHVAALRILNVLARAGEPPRAHPVAVRVQRVYLEAAEAWAERTPERPEWVERCLTEWRATLDALQCDDLDWLRARLDPFAKHALMEAVLDAEGVPWTRLASTHDALAMLGLLDHDFHELARPDGLLRRLELSGLVRHRVAPTIEPGTEPDPFVPGLGTRADARARWIRERAHHAALLADWSYFAEPVMRRWARLDDPFADTVGPWETLDPVQLAKLFNRGGLPRTSGTTPAVPVGLDLGPLLVPRAGPRRPRVTRDLTGELPL